MVAPLSRRGFLKALAPDAPVVPPGLRISASCLETRGVACRRCADECETGALSYRLMGAGRAQVIVDDVRCDGCGACVPICPVRAIEYIRAEPVEALS